MSRAGAGATTTRSALLARLMWGTGSPLGSKSDVRAGSAARALQVSGATKRAAPRVSTGKTTAPRSLSRRQTSTALYAAMPPETPRTTVLASRALATPPRLEAGDDRLLGAVLFAAPVEGDLAGRNFLESDRERLAGDRGDLRGHDRTQALAQLVEVGVHLTAALGCKADQGVLGVHPLEQLLDRRLHHRCSVFWHFRCKSTIAASSWAARSKSSFTTTWSASLAPWRCSSSPTAMRRRTWSSSSPRQRRRSAWASLEGAFTMTRTAPGYAALT